MNILYVNTQFKLFDNLDSGAANRSTMFIRALASAAHVDVITFRGTELSNIPNCDVVYCEHIGYQDSGAGRIDKFARLFKYWDPESIFSVDKRKAEVVNRFVAAGQYDYIAVRYLDEMVICGLWKYADKLILDIDDHPRNAMLVKMKMCKSAQNRLYHRLLAEVVGQTIRVVAHRVHCSFYSNILQQPSKRSVYLHNITMTEDVTRTQTITRIKGRILIVGLLDYFPNREGVTHFISFVLPMVRKLVPEAHLVLCGRLMDEGLKKEWSSIPGVEVKGFVDDLAAEYAASSVVAVPLYTGSGTSVKVVEAMTMYRPCVTTPMGIRGIDAFAKEGEDYLLARDDEDFAKKIVALLTDEAQAQRIADSAREVIHRSFSQEAFIKIVKQTI